jgi:hypothetical protein
MCVKGCFRRGTTPMAAACSIQAILIAQDIRTTRPTDMAGSELAVMVESRRPTVWPIVMTSSPIGIYHLLFRAEFQSMLACMRRNSCALLRNPYGSHDPLRGGLITDRHQQLRHNHTERNCRSLKLDLHLVLRANSGHRASFKRPPDPGRTVQLKVRVGRWRCRHPVCKAKDLLSTLAQRRRVSMPKRRIASGKSSSWSAMPWAAVLASA